MQSLKYSPDEKGVCFGIAAMSSQAIIRKKRQDFVERINFIKNTSRAELETLNHTHKTKHIELLSFFDELSIYQGATCADIAFSSIIPKDQGINNIRLGKPSNPNDQEFIYPQVKAKLVCVFTEIEFVNFLLEMQQHLNDEPFSIILTHSPQNHATQIGFDGTTWLSTNHDDVMIESSPLNTFQAVVDNIFMPKNYAGKHCMTASLEILLSEKSKANLPNLKDYDFAIDTLTDAIDKEILANLLACYDHSLLYDSVISILNKIESFKLTQTEKKTLIEAKRSNDSTLLMRAADKGELNVLKKILTTMDVIGFSTQEKVNIINKKNKGDGTALNFAIQNGHENIVKALLKTISSFENEHFKIQCFHLKSIDGAPAIYTAAGFGQGSIMRMLLNALPAVENDKLKAELLSAYDDDGTPALLIAAQNGHQDTVELLLGAISTIKDEKLIIKLLSAKRKDGASALFMATQDEHASVVNSIQQAMLKTKLPKDQDEAVGFLSGKNEDNVTALIVAMENNDVKTTKIIINNILASNIPVEIKVKLLKSQVPSLGIISAFDDCANKDDKSIFMLLENVVKNHNEFSNKDKEMILQRKAKLPAFETRL